MTAAPLRRAFHLSVPLVLAFAGALAARGLGTPMPWMLGALFATAALAMVVPVGSRFTPPFPESVRSVCVGVIGVLVGGTFSPQVMASLGGWWVTILAMGLVTIAIQLAAYHWLLRAFRLDAATAWFASSPGGFLESITLGEANGGDVRLISVMQFLRLVVVSVTLPFAFSIWNGGPVGSAAGVKVGDGTPLTLLDAILLLAMLPAGIAVARRLRFTAGALVVPMVLSAVAHGAGLVHGQVPPKLVYAAQLVMGTSLGLRFAGLPRRHLLKAAAGSISAMAIAMALVALAVAVVHPFSGSPPEVLVLAFTPGGLVEMGLIALSIGANPVFIIAHHLFRIVLTVTALPQWFQRMIAPARKTARDELSQGRSTS